MKLNFITSALIFSALLAGFSACQKQNESEVHDTVVIRTQLTSATPAMTAAGGTDKITIDATCGWSMECEDWFTVEPASGEAGISESIITIQPNETGAARVGTIKLKAGSYGSTYKFTQAGK